ncbi:MAG: hypothetical protein N2053_09815, partial [Chitinispirillaceae bacterium]|nr:hypothetical protein [Chitinispirillaceae bacterium]
VKFGLWMGRGISRKAVKQNLPIYGTPYRASEIASFTDTSNWFFDNYGVDMSKPGSQEYYNSVIDLLGSWGVDFIKYDDIVPHPDEIEAVVKAIELSGYNIKLSLSPGGDATMKNMSVYSKADMVRITNDVWDSWLHIEESFLRWEEFQYFISTKCNIDLDMIPFGILFYPKVHHDNFSIDEKLTFVTQRAMAGSPLFLGGRLPEMDSLSLALVTNNFMLECNRKCTIGRLIYRDHEIDIWKSLDINDTLCCWIGIFNRSNTPVKRTLENLQIGLHFPLSAYSIFDIWKQVYVSYNEKESFTIPSHGVVFLKLTYKG